MVIVPELKLLHKTISIASSVATHSFDEPYLKVMKIKVLFKGKFVSISDYFQIVVQFEVILNTGKSMFIVYKYEHSLLKSLEIKLNKQ